MNTITAQTHAYSDPAFQKWVQLHQLEMCVELVAVDDTLTEWMGEFMAGTRLNRIETELRTVHTTPADPTWCDK